MRVPLLLAFASLLCASVSHGQKEDPFGPEKKTPKRGQANKSDAAFNRVINVARRLFEADFVEAGGGASDDGTYRISVLFESKTVPAKDLQERLVRAASTLYRTKIPLRELSIIVKSNRDDKGREDPTDFVRVQLNLDAAKNAKWQSPKTLDFKELFTLTWIRPDYLQLSPEAWPAVRKEE